MPFLTPTREPSVVGIVDTPVETDSSDTPPTPEEAILQLAGALSDVFTLLDKLTAALRAQNAAIMHINKTISYRREVDARFVPETIGTLDV